MAAKDSDSLFTSNEKKLAPDYSGEKVGQTNLPMSQANILETNGHNKSIHGAIQSGILEKVLTFLPTKSVAQIALVSQSWKASAISDRVWKPICERRWKGRWRPCSNSSVHESHRASSSNNFTWKLRYIQEEKDAIRTKILEEELCTFWWRFKFQQSPTTAVQYVKFVRKHNHGFLIMESGYPPMRYRVGEDTSGENVVYIELFPPHVISRTEDWRWTIKNMFVSMQSIDVDEIPEDRRENVMTSYSQAIRSLALRG
eukprot:jgi/Bigna1/64664/fgenesh1_kg.81_\